MVTLTASATSVTPCRIPARAPTPKLISLDTKFLLDNTPPYTCPQKNTLLSIKPYKHSTTNQWQFRMQKRFIFIHYYTNKAKLTRFLAEGEAMEEVTLRAKRYIAICNCKFGATIVELEINFRRNEMRSEVK